MRPLLLEVGEWVNSLQKTHEYVYTLIKTPNLGKLGIHLTNTIGGDCLDWAVSHQHN